eukprot:6407306-Pyramimonas_sp.AAC.1
MAPPTRTCRHGLTWRARRISLPADTSHVHLFSCTHKIAGAPVILILFSAVAWPRARGHSHL